ncbi:hypothetical protein [Flagellimonas sp. CMM7]|uniref:hypothetical protein n=1 Tax=Flagellimonas sp. CMM7 TaxID=2654676 RepID=UPI0013D2AB8C|nr:hypothetical protein [Flagellimonas sp. CMM7]UII80048.1 SETD3 family histone-lysine N-methyltransferase [Flagellimonas sp. CMM7]
MNTLTIKKTEDSAFSSIESFENAQRMAKVLVQSSLVPTAYKNNIPNAMIALEMANRIGISPFMVMQNLDVIQGKPSWNSTFIIAILNSCGRFAPIRFVFDGEGEDYGCRAVTKDTEGNKLEGTKITMRMVKAEGWLSKGGSKWKTMPDQMFQYRAASFFGRIYAPDLLKGMHSSDEVKDIIPEPIKPDNSEEAKRIMGFIEGATTLEELEEVKKKLSKELLEEYAIIIEDAENNLILNQDG